MGNKKMAEVDLAAACGIGVKVMKEGGAKAILHVRRSKFDGVLLFGELPIWGKDRYVKGDALVAILAKLPKSDALKIITAAQSADPMDRIASLYGSLEHPTLGETVAIKAPGIRQ